MTKALSIISLLIFFGLSCFAGISFRPELNDGVQVLFQMLNSHTYTHYINSRALGHFLEYTVLFNYKLIAMGLTFEDIYSIHNLSLALNPFIITLITVVFLFIVKKSQYIPFYFINVFVVIFLSYSFHVSLLSESILLAWLAFFCWKFSYSWISYLLGIPAAILYHLGYESVLIFSFAIFIATAIEIKKKTLKDLPQRDAFLKILIPAVSFAMILYRTITFEKFGQLENSLAYAFTANYPETYLILFSLLVLAILTFSRVDFRWIFGIALTGLALIFVYIPIDKYHYLAGYYLRSLMVFPSFIIFLITIYLSTKLKKDTQLLHNFTLMAFLFLIFFSLSDLKRTFDWREYRQQQFTNLNSFSDGCHIVDDENWSLPYFSILLQSSFRPQKLLIPSKSGSGCEFIMAGNRRIPSLIINDNIRTFYFTSF